MEYFNKSLRPIPEDWFGLKDEEEKLRKDIWIFFSIKMSERWLKKIRILEFN